MYNVMYWRKTTKLIDERNQDFKVMAGKDDLAEGLEMEQKQRILWHLLLWTAKFCVG